jgi:penicillin V acylase-like amidase (Ntn superfamily)
MTNKLKFTQVSRVIDPKTRIHYLDAIDENGMHWMAQMEHDTEKWLCFSRVWYQDAQQPLDL